MAALAVCQVSLPAASALMIVLNVFQLQLAAMVIGRPPRRLAMHLLLPLMMAAGQGRSVRLTALNASQLPAATTR